MSFNNSSDKSFFSTTAELDKNNIIVNIGIIDFPEVYSAIKKAERIYKLGKQPSLDPSTANAKYYGNRFVNFCQKIILNEDK